MKTIGLIGGMSWESSKVYYELLNQRVKSLLGGVHSCQCVMVSVDFAAIEKLTFEDDWEGIGQIMARCTRQLEAAGADLIVLCTNTIHLVSNYIINNTQLPFLHIAEVTGKAIQQAGIQKVALLGTRFTMEKDFYTRTLEEQFGLELMIPELADRERLQNMIYKELVKGQFTDEARKDCLRMIEDLKGKGAQGAILGCTELPILLEGLDAGVPTFDTTTLHAHAAVAMALDKHGS